MKITKAKRITKELRSTLSHIDGHIINVYDTKDIARPRIRGEVHLFFDKMISMVYFRYVQQVCDNEKVSYFVTTDSSHRPMIKIY